MNRFFFLYVSFFSIILAQQIDLHQFTRFRFIVFFNKDEVKYTSDEFSKRKYAVDKINEYLSKNGYRYVEPVVLERMFEDLLFESVPCDPTTQEQKIANECKAGFYFDLANLKDTIYERKGLTGDFPKTYQVGVSIELKLYDTGTGEGVTNARVSISLDDSLISRTASWNKEEARRKAIDITINEACDTIFTRLAKSMEAWTETGYPYYLRFYGLGNDKTPLLELVNELKDDSLLGSINDIRTQPSCNYGDVIIAYKGPPDELFRRVEDISKNIPGLNDLILSDFIFNRLVFSVNHAPTPKQPAKTINIDSKQGKIIFDPDYYYYNP